MPVQSVSDFSISRSDRLWFARHQQSLVRFRPSRAREFDQLLSLGLEPSLLIPPGFDPSLPATWVAVIDLVRVLVPSEAEQGYGFRVRISTIPIRSAALKASLSPLFVQAALRDLFDVEFSGDRLSAA